MKLTPAKWLLCFIPAVLAGCASMSPSECATADWRQRGEQDGRQGNEDRSASYFEACSKAGIGVDVTTYRSGRALGLQSYCRLGNAITEGLAGRPYGDVCPQPTDQSFRSIHVVAFRVQETQKNVSRLRDKQDRLQAELVSDKTANDRKVTLRDLLNRSDRQLRDARNAQFAAEQQFNAMSDDMRRRGIN